MAKWARRFPALVAVLAAAALPLLPLPPFLQSVLIEILIYGVVAAATDLLIGYTGLVPLGQAAFVAAGGYAAGLAGSKLSPNLLLTLAAAVLCAGAVALIIGYFSIRSREVYFLMLTLAFGQLVYSAAFQWKSVTGGSDGLVGIPRPELFGHAFVDTPEFFYLTLAVFALCLWWLRRVTRSPFGQVLVGIRENEHRVRALGYNTQRFKLASFVLAGAVAGVGGWLLSAFNGYISPDAGTWVRSGEVVLMVIIGGAGTLYGPVLGTAVVLLLERLVSSYVERWPTILGVVFVVVVLLRPDGLLSLFRRRAAAPAAGDAATAGGE